jgi:NAD(P)-dependent dehydrogenase (short-subunit alcohol dehydrogenase family)
MDLDGRIAVVTGGTRGIGFGIAQTLLQGGARVVVSSRSADKGAEAVEQLGSFGEVSFKSCDVQDQGQVEQVIDEVAAELGRLDILVNNAGGADGFALLHEMTDETWTKASRWILDSAFWSCRRALPHMMENQWGRIINISSIAGKQAKKPGSAHYVTFKHALNGFTKAVARDYGEMGVTANAICPGPVETDAMADAGRASAARRGLSYEEYLAQYAADTMTKRLVTVDEVAAVARLLASPAGAGITGTTINVDGGTLPW